MIKGEYKNFGFIPPSIKETDYFLGQGNLPRIVLQKNGDWTDALPIIETQIRNNIDSINCTGFAITTQTEMYEYKAFGERNNYSDRWVALISGTTPQGNTPSNVYEAIRKYGLVPEEMCPWSEDIQSIDEYLSWKGVDKEACFREGLRWKERKDFMHNWVFRATQPLDEKLNNMKVALKYSPLAFDVEAWEKNADGKYIRLGLSGHWTTCYNIGEFIDVFDSYEPYLKQLVKDYNFFYCKRISITKKLNIAQKKSIWELIKAFLFGHDEEIKKLEPILKPVIIANPPQPIIEMPREKLKRLCIENLGKDLSVLAPNELGCADALSTILREIYPDFPWLISTVQMQQHFVIDKRFKPTLDITPWSVILSPTGSGSGVIPYGHVGVLGEGDIIYSNNSLTGKWDNHWTRQKWIDFYRVKGKMKIYFYKIV